MITKTWKCDRCGKTASDRNDADILNLVGISVGYREYEYKNPYSGGQFVVRDDAGRSIDMCRQCRMELGIERDCSKDSTKEEPANLATVEDLIRIIVRVETGEHDRS